MGHSNSENQARGQQAMETYASVLPPSTCDSASLSSMHRSEVVNCHSSGLHSMAVALEEGEALWHSPQLTPKTQKGLVGSLSIHAGVKLLCLLSHLMVSLTARGAEVQEGKRTLANCGQDSVPTFNLNIWQAKKLHCNSHGASGFETWPSDAVHILRCSRMIILPKSSLSQCR